MDFTKTIVRPVPHDPKCCLTIYITYKNKNVEYTICGYKKGIDENPNQYDFINICADMICRF